MPQGGFGTYAVGVLAFPSAGSGQAAERYFIFLVFFVFALCERKNEKQNKEKYHAAAGLEHRYRQVRHS
jgi:hypothetical protein